MNISKEEVIKAIQVCQDLRHTWCNGRIPDDSHSSNVKDIQNLLSELLELSPLLKDSNKYRNCGVCGSQIVD